MTLAENLADLQRHEADFAARVRFYLYRAGGGERLRDYRLRVHLPGGFPDAGNAAASVADVRSWVSADRAPLDMVLHEAVSKLAVRFGLAVRRGQLRAALSERLAPGRGAMTRSISRTLTERSRGHPRC